MSKRKDERRNGIIKANYIPLFGGNEHFLTRLTDEEAGKILKGLYTYRSTGNKPDLGKDRYFNFVFDTFASPITKYYEQAEAGQVEQEQEEPDVKTQNTVEVVMNGEVKKYNLRPRKVELVYETDPIKEETPFYLSEEKTPELTEKEELVLYWIKEAVNKFPVRKDGYFRAPGPYLYRNTGINENRLAPIKKSLMEKGFIDYHKDEEERFHIYKVLKDYNFKKTA